MGVLVIGEKEQAAIALAIQMAKAKPTPWARMRDAVVDDSDMPTGALKLDKRRNPDLLAALKEEYPSYGVELGTYTVAISFEEQSSGLFRHLSIAARTPGLAPNEHVAKMVLEAFGFSGYPLTRPHNIWVEEYEPGHVAVNFCELEAIMKISGGA